VIITDVHRRAGLDEEQYAQVTYYVIQGPKHIVLQGCVHWMAF
jgi:hypothetical protein